MSYINKERLSGELKKITKIDEVISGSALVITGTSTFVRFINRPKPETISAYSSRLGEPWGTLAAYHSIPANQVTEGIMLFTVGAVLALGLFNNRRARIIIKQLGL